VNWWPLLFRNRPAATALKSAKVAALSPQTRILQM
jgi:hypothetical protein